MKFLISLILIICTITSTFAAASIGRFEDKAHPGKCVLNGLILSPGDVHNDQKECQQTSCFENSIASSYSCGVFKPPEGCVLGKPKYPKDPYPKCCDHHIICNNIIEK